MIENYEDLRFLPLIHVARGLLMIPLPFIIWNHFLVYWFDADFMLSTVISLIAVGVLVVMFEFYRAIKLFKKRENPWFNQNVLAISMSFFMLLLTQEIPSLIVDSIVESIWISFVIGLSIIELGLIALHK